MAGFFGLFDFAKEGPGVNKKEAKKKRFFFFWELYTRKFWRLVLLNLLYFALCLPIVTIGPATAGFFFVLRKLSNEEPVFLVSDFFEGFRKNWKQSCVIFLLDVVLCFLLPFATDFYYAQAQVEGSASWLFYIPMGLCASAMFIGLMMHYYIHLLIVTTNLKLKPILKNSFLLTCIAFKTNFLTTVFVAVAAVAAIGLSLLFFPLIILIPFIVLSTIGFIISFNSYQYILKYVVEPFYRDMPWEEIPDQIKRTLHLDEDEEESEEESEKPIFQDMGQQELSPEAKAERANRTGRNKTIS